MGMTFSSWFSLGSVRTTNAMRFEGAFVGLFTLNSSMPSLSSRKSRASKPQPYHFIQDVGLRLDGDASKGSTMLGGAAARLGKELEVASASC